MTEKKPASRKPSRAILFSIIALFLVGGLAFYLWYTATPDPVPKPPAPPEKDDVTRQPIPAPEVIDLSKLDQDEKLQDRMDERKANFGLTDGLDAVVQSDEMIQVGDRMVSMKEIAEQIRMKSGDILEQDIKDNGAVDPGKIRYFGIYIVKPGDNIWNIHFRLLQDYFNHKGIPLSPRADEPGQNGRSSGIGKILKFSENMVHIYNVREKRLDVDLNLIEPMSKIVIYNMEKVFSMLDQIDPEGVENIQFDGETLWIATES